MATSRPRRETKSLVRRGRGDFVCRMGGSAAGACSAGGRRLGVGRGHGGAPRPSGPESTSSSPMGAGRARSGGPGPRGWHPASVHRHRCCHPRGPPAHLFHPSLPRQSTTPAPWRTAPNSTRPATGASLLSSRWAKASGVGQEGGRGSGRRAPGAAPRLCADPRIQPPTPRLSPFRQCDQGVGHGGGHHEEGGARDAGVRGRLCVRCGGVAPQNPARRHPDV